LERVGGCFDHSQDPYAYIHFKKNTGEDIFVKIFYGEMSVSVLPGRLLAFYLDVAQGKGNKYRVKYITQEEFDQKTTELRANSTSNPNSAPSPAY